MKKKLERQLRAAGIFYKIDSTYLNVYTEDPSTSGDIDYSKSYSLEELRTDINWFECIKQEIGFKGNDWDGLKKRLEESEDWIRAPYGIYSNKFEYCLFDERNALFNNCFGYWDEAKNEYKFKYHNCWKLLDKIDNAKAKGGKQTVKFKGNEYEFDFPNLIIEECNEHTEEQLKELKPRKSVESEPKEPAWKSVTGWDGVKEYSLTYYADEDEIKWIDRAYKENFATEKQAKQVLALSQLTQIHKAMMEGQTFKEIQKNREGGDMASVSYIYFEDEYMDTSFFNVNPNLHKCQCTPFQIEFYTDEQLNHFIEHNADLIDQYLGI